MARIWMRSQFAFKAANTGSTRRAVPMLVSGLALMAGAVASSGAQAQCTGAGTDLFPFGSGSGVNALTSVISTVNTAFMNTGSAFVAASGAAPDQLGGGVWARAIGGTVNTEANSSFSGQLSYADWSTFNPATHPFPDQVNVSANDSCRTKVQQDFKGFQAGHDIALLNSDNTGMNWHFGGLAGYVQTDIRDQTPGGTLKGNFNVPFAGLYTAFSKGNLFADAQARLDYFQGELTDPANGFQNQRLDARGYSITGNLGYRIDLGGNWNVEPSVGGVISRTWVDKFDVSGVNSGYLPPFNAPIVKSLPGRVQMQAVDSQLARASLKMGTAAALGSDIVAYPFVSASVFHEFADNVTATFSPGGFAGNINGTLTSGRIGTFALFSAGSAFLLADTGWMGYGRVDYRAGDNIDGLSFNAGLRYQLNPDAAGLKEGGSLKDGPVEGYSWTGPYAGVSAGGVRSDVDWAAAPFPIEAENAGYLAGGQLGYNLQVGHFVWGVEGEYGVSNARGVTNCAVLPTPHSCESNVNSLGAVTGRLGYSFGRTLIYGKGGWAFGELSSGKHLNNPDLETAPLPWTAAPSTSATYWQTGWTAGGGMEIALTDRWSAKAEYMHYEFPDKLAPVENKSATTGDSVKVGVNYHLGQPGAEGAQSAAPLK
jgi:opacity protein-like surface antigen